MPAQPARQRVFVRAIAGAIVSTVLVMPAAANLDPALQCRLGAWRLSDGRSLAVTGIDGSTHDLRYLFSSGEYGPLFSTPGGD